ncbi:hypothetical protein ACFLZB_00985 [Nanoarchaeota archaeon]
MNPKIVGAVQIVLPLIAFVIAVIDAGFSSTTIALALLVLTFIFIGVQHLTGESHAHAPSKPAGMPPQGMPPPGMAPPRPGMPPM